MDRKPTNKNNHRAGLSNNKSTEDRRRNRRFNIVITIIAIIIAAITIVPILLGIVKPLDQWTSCGIRTYHDPRELCGTPPLTYPTYKYWGCDSEITTLILACIIPYIIAFSLLIILIHQHARKEYYMTRHAIATIILTIATSIIVPLVTVIFLNSMFNSELLVEPNLPYILTMIAVFIEIVGSPMVVNKLVVSSALRRHRTMNSK